MVESLSLQIYVSLAYAIANLVMGAIIYVRSRKSRLSKFYILGVTFLTLLAISGYLLEQSVKPPVVSVLEEFALLVYSFFPFYFLHFVVIFLRRYDILRGKRVVLSIYLTGLFSYSMAALGFISKPITAATGVSPTGYVFFITWMSIFFSVGVALLYSLITGFKEHEAKSRLLLIGFALVMLLLPSPFTESIISLFSGEKFQWYFASSTVALGIAVYLIFRHRIIMNTPYQVLKSALAAMNDILIKMNSEFTIEMARGAVVPLLGYEEKELIGKTFADFIERKDHLEIYRQCVLNGKMRESFFDTSVITKAGAHLPINFCLTPVYANEEIDGFIAVGRNIAEREEAQAALRRAHEELEIRVQERTAELAKANEALRAEIAERKKAEMETLLQKTRFQQLFENAPMGIVMMDEQDRILYANRGFEKIFQFSSKEIKGRHLNEVIVPDGLEEEAQTLSRRTLSGESIERESVRRRKDGSLVHVHIYGVPIGLNHHPLGIYGMYVDVTERKEAERALRQSEEKFRTLAETASCAIIIYQNEDIKYVNPAAEAITGYTREELLRMKFWEIVHPEMQKQARERGLARLTGEEVPTRYELKILTKKGEERWIDLTAGLIEYEGQPAGLGTAFDITTRKNAEENLARSLSLLGATLESTEDGILVVNEEGKIESFNQRFLEMWHIPESILTSGNDEEALAFVMGQLKDPEGFLAKVREVYADPETESFDILEFKDGRIFERYSRPQRIAGRSVGRVWSFHDATERRRSAREREILYEIGENVSTSANLDELLAKIHACIKEVMYAENCYIALYDPKTEIVSFPFFVDQNDPRPYPRGKKRGLTEYVLRIGEPVLLTPGLFEELVRKNEVEQIGTPPVSWLGVPLFIRSELIGVLVVQSYEEGKVYTERERDLLAAIGNQAAFAIERKRSEEALRRSEERYRALFEESKDVVFISSPDGKFIDINPAGVELFGYSSRDEVLQIDIDKDLYVNPVDREAMISEIIHHGYIKDREITVKRKDGQRVTVLESVTAARDEKGNIVAFRGTLRDITEQKRLEQQLIQSQKMESIGTLAGGIAHDFNNILAIILGYASRLKRVVYPRRTSLSQTEAANHPLQCIEPEARSKLTQSVEEIHKAVQRGAKLVQQLLTFARKTDVVSEPVNVNTVVEDLLRMLTETFPKTITFSVKLDRKVPSINADSNQLHQALLNLCLNARDAMPSGGTLTITTCSITNGTMHQKFSEATAQSYVHITVKDTGVGMDDETRIRIFEPFFTTKERGKGTGLGLAVVYGIVKNHNGFIEVESAPGEGTTFGIYLPVVQRALSTVDKELNEEIPGGTETILLVEDEEVLARLVRTFLEEKGYRLLVARDGAEAIEMYQRHRDEIQLVFADMGLPILGGWEVFLKMKELNPDIKVIFASGYLDPSAKSELLKKGAKDFIQKPFEPEKVLRRIRQVLDYP